MSETIRDVIGLGVASLILAGFVYAIAHGGSTGDLFQSFASGWSNIISSATHPG